MRQHDKANALVNELQRFNQVGCILQCMWSCSVLHCGLQCHCFQNSIDGCLVQRLPTKTLQVGKATPVEQLQAFNQVKVTSL